MSTNLQADTESNDVLGQTTAQRLKFIKFLSSRVDAGVAEDILQSAYIKAMEHAGEMLDDESNVACSIAFFATRTRIDTGGSLREPGRRIVSLLKHQRATNRSSSKRACIGRPPGSQKRYREAIQQVDLDGVSVQAFAVSQEPLPTTYPCSFTGQGRTLPKSSQPSAEPARNTIASIAPVGAANCKIAPGSASAAVERPGEGPCAAAAINWKSQRQRKRSCLRDECRSSNDEHEPV